jgi:hypothetical protein
VGALSNVAVFWVLRGLLKRVGVRVSPPTLKPDAVRAVASSLNSSGTLGWKRSLIEFRQMTHHAFRERHVKCGRMDA